MSKTPNTPATIATTTDPAPAPVGRRGIVAGVGVAGAAAAAAALLPRGVAPASPADANPLPAAADAPRSGGGGYELTDHVKHYYRTARI